MKRLQKGSFTVEAAVVIPLLLFTIGIIMMLLLYCHDKNVLKGAVEEAVLIEAGRSGGTDYDLLIEDKLLWFQAPQIEVTEENGNFVATATASRSVTSIRVEAKIAITQPETFIRNVRKFEKITGGEDENTVSDGFE